MKIIPKLFLAFILSFSISGCQKNAGVGGDASIRGKVFVRHYNTTFSTLISSYYGPDIYVYIIYGDDISYGDKTNTGFDGKFEFKYLRKGKYKLYVYSENYNFMTGFIKDSAIVKQVEITDKKQDVDAGTFEIVKYK